MLLKKYLNFSDLDTASIPRSCPGASPVPRTITRQRQTESPLLSGPAHGRCGRGIGATDAPAKAGPGCGCTSATGFFQPCHPVTTDLP